MTSPGNDNTLFHFDPQLVAAQIREQAPCRCPPKP